MKTFFAKVTKYNKFKDDYVPLPFKKKDFVHKYKILERVESPECVVSGDLAVFIKEDSELSRHIDHIYYEMYKDNLKFEVYLKNFSMDWDVNIEDDLYGSGNLLDCTKNYIEGQISDGMWENGILLEDFFNRRLIYGNVESHIVEKFKNFGYIDSDEEKEYFDTKEERDKVIREKFEKCMLNRGE